MPDYLEQSNTDISTDISQARITEINDLHKKFESTIKKAAQTAFEIGQMLYDMSMSQPPEVSWVEYVENTFIFTYRTASSYIRIYNSFKDCPEELADMTITQALKVNKKNKNIIAPNEIKAGNPSEERKIDIESIFKKPPVSEITLNNYRFECPDDQSLWLYKKGYNFPINVLKVQVDEPKKDLRPHYDEMMRNIQIALEQYYKAVEREEGEI